ncbi:response regulator [Listeria welshimeri]|nr:response regulator [Listeria welshimeri]MBC1669734.1 response regulator [Listeria welshimeri]MBC6179269.1 response regulator [Listeria welshimeri]
MSYSYKILVIDDEIDIRTNYAVYKQYIKKEEIDTEFTFVSSTKELDKVQKDTFDILMVDYNLQNSFFSEIKPNIAGTDFIKSFREENRISKIIFYSSEFEYSDSEKRYHLNLKDKDIFDLINSYKIDSIVSKNNFDMVVHSIIDNIRDLDPIAKLLINTRDKYDQRDSQLYYTTSDGEEMNIEQLLQEYQADSKRGKEFKDQLLSTIVTLLLEYRY